MKKRKNNKAKAKARAKAKGKARASNKGKHIIHWHKGFAATIHYRFRLYEQQGKIVIQTEHGFTQEALRADVIIIKKDESIVIPQGMGKIFRRINILEYKSPEVSLTINDFYKIIAYAFLYIEQNYKENETELNITDFTISYVVTQKPEKLLAYLERYECRVTETEPGIYQIKVPGIDIPMQLIETKLLEDADDLPLKGLHGGLSGEELAEVTEAFEERYERWVNIYLDILTQANPKGFEEAQNMAKYKSVRDALVKLGIAKEFVAQGVAQGEARGENTVLSLMRQGYTADEIEAMLKRERRAATAA
jgi:hypothetical protein